MTQEFTPTSEKFKFIDPHQKVYSDTQISYKFGKKNNKDAIQLFLRDELIATRYKNFQTSSFDIQAYGGQDMSLAQSQREECLQAIIEHYFCSHGCRVEIEPQLDNFSPDMLITKGDLKFYIELKAYSKSNICGDPEIAQAMKYFEKVT